jgi:hypothetical protein
MSPLRSCCNMLTRLAPLDGLEVAAFYAGAQPEDQRAIEVASASVGRQPVRRADGVLV